MTMPASANNSPARRPPQQSMAAVEQRQVGSVSGQASAELRALLHQRLVMTEGTGSPERASLGGAALPVRSTSVLADGPQVAAKAWVTQARTVLTTGVRGSSMVVPAAPNAAAANGVRRMASAATQMSPKAAWRGTIGGATATPAVPGMRPPSLSDATTDAEKKALASPALGSRQLHEAKKRKNAQDFRSNPVEVPLEAVSTRQNLQRGVTASFAEAELRARKVSCGKLYEELAFLRKENMVLQRTCTELEQRAGEDVPRQLADEVTKLRQENEGLQSANTELRGQVRELSSTAAAASASAAREQQRSLDLQQQAGKRAAGQQPEADAGGQGTSSPVPREELEAMLQQQERLARELEELSRERRELLAACAEQSGEEGPELRERREQLERRLLELQRGLEESGLGGRLSELTERLGAVQRQARDLEEELSALRGAHAQELSALREANAGLHRRCAELEAAGGEAARQREELLLLQRRQRELLEEKAGLEAELAQLGESLKAGEERHLELEEERARERRALEEAFAAERRAWEEERRRLLAEAASAAHGSPASGRREARDEPPSPCSHSRLKAVLTDRHATLEQLRGAIGSAEALLGEAKREFAAKQLREKRACYERLHAAIEAEQEEALDEALALARRAEVDAEDLAKGAAKLELLRSLSAEQRRAKALHELGVMRRKEAYLLAKKDEAERLAELLDGLDEAIRWQDWRDYMGRSLYRFATEMRAQRVIALLAPMLGMPNPQEPPAGSSTPATTPPRPPALAEERAATLPLAEPEKAVEPAEEEPAVKPAVAVAAPEKPRNAPSEREEAALRAKAFRAVVQDDTGALADVLGQLELEMWSAWQNKAGKDLLTLSQERGASGAYSLLAKALGLVQEQKRESFEEREAVWIFAQGEVQPRRATVLEDTPEEAESILVEYWDGDEPAGRVDRCLVRKMWS